MAALLAAPNFLLAAALDPCALMRKADVEAALAPRSFDAGTPGASQPGTAKLAAVASCTFTSQAPRPRDMLSVTVVVRRAPDGVKGPTMAAVKAGAVKLKGVPVDVPGLGDGAYWINLGTEENPQYQLNVMVGNRYWLIFSSFGLRTEPARSIEVLAKLARATLPRL